MEKQRMFHGFLFLILPYLINSSPISTKKDTNVTTSLTPEPKVSTLGPTHGATAPKNEPIIIYGRAEQGIFLKNGSSDALLIKASTPYMAFDEMRKRLFWSGRTNNNTGGKGHQSAIFQVTLGHGNGTVDPTIFAIPSFKGITQGVGSSAADNALPVLMTWLEYDWAGENVYFVDLNRGICLCNRHSTCVILVNKSVTHGKLNDTEIALDPGRGRMYWSLLSKSGGGRSETGQIVRADMDGMDPIIIIVRKRAAKLLTVDPQQRGKLYWFEREDLGDEGVYFCIMSSNLDGNVSGTSYRPRYLPLRIHVASDDVYFSVYLKATGMVVLRSYNNTDPVTRHKWSMGPHSNQTEDFYVFDPNSKPPMNESPCRHNPCSHICVPKPGGNMACLCPPGSNLLPLNHSCVSKPTGTFDTLATTTVSAISFLPITASSQNPQDPGKTEDPIKETTEKIEQATNTNGFTTATFKGANLPDMNLIIYASAGAGGGVVLLIVLTIIILKVRRKARDLRNLTAEESSMFLEGGDPSALSDAPDGVHRALLLRYAKLLHPDSIQIVDVGRGKLLGVGEYSMVYGGQYNSKPVVAKTLDRSVHVDEFKAVLAQVKAMAYVGDHANIIKFWGADVSAIRKRKIAIVTELSPKGNLLNHLWDSALKGLKMEDRITEGQADESKDMMSFLKYMEITTATLVRYCEQIAAGMEFLANKGIVHGDLATRNVLVFGNNILKISDFGRCKHSFTTKRVIMRRLKTMSWRWASIELLTTLEFSEASDVWAFGITVWEIFSFGLVPYKGMKFNAKFIQLLKSGSRLVIPHCAPTTINRLLPHCWSSDPSDRPNFSKLRKIFGKLLAQANVRPVEDDRVTKLIQSQSCLSHRNVKQTYGRKCDGNLAQTTAL